VQAHDHHAAEAFSGFEHPCSEFAGAWTLPVVLSLHGTIFSWITYATATAQVHLPAGTRTMGRGFSNKYFQ
jgi:hypothetical protein